MEDYTIKKAGMYFISTIAIDRTLGMENRKKEQYVIEACSFTDAEAKTFGIDTPCSFILKDLSVAPFYEALLSNAQEADIFYRVRVRQTILDEHKGKEVKKTKCCLVRAKSASHAERIVSQAYSDTSVDFVVVSITETRIVDIINNN